MATISFNVSEVTPAQEYKPLPEGKYEAVIADSDVKPTRSGNGSYIQLEFEVVSGEYKGRKLWGRYNIENSNREAVEIGRSQFAAVCQAVNIPSPRDTSELHNCTLILSVKCRRRKDSDELENTIGGYKPKTAAAAPQAATVEKQPAAPAVTAPAPSTAPWAR
jgi:hypothetical protein